MSGMRETVDLRAEYYRKLNELKRRELDVEVRAANLENLEADADWLIEENEQLKQDKQELEHRNSYLSFEVQRLTALLY